MSCHVKKSESTSPVGWGWAEFCSGTYNEIKFYPRAKLHIFHYNVIHNYNTMGDETLYQELPPHTSTHTRIPTHSQIKKVNSCIYLSQRNAYSFNYAFNHLTGQYLSLHFFPVSRSAPKHANFVLPEASHHAPAAYDMAIREHTWIRTHVTFGLNSKQSDNTTIARGNKKLLSNTRDIFTYRLRPILERSPHPLGRSSDGFSIAASQKKNALSCGVK